MSSAVNHAKRSHRSDRAHYAALHAMPQILPNNVKDIAPVWNRQTRREKEKEFRKLQSSKKP